MANKLNKKREEFISQLKKCGLFSEKEIDSIIQEQDKDATEKIQNPYLYEFDIIKIRFQERFNNPGYPIMN